MSLYVVLFCVYFYVHMCICLGLPQLEWVCCNMNRHVARQPIQTVFYSAGTSNSTPMHVYTCTLFTYTCTHYSGRLQAHRADSSLQIPCHHYRRAGGVHPTAATMPGNIRRDLGTHAEHGKIPVIASLFGIMRGGILYSMFLIHIIMHKLIRTHVQCF